MPSRSTDFGVCKTIFFGLRDSDDSRPSTINDGRRAGLLKPFGVGKLEVLLSEPNDEPRDVFEENDCKVGTYELPNELVESILSVGEGGHCNEKIGSDSIRARGCLGAEFALLLARGVLWIGERGVPIL